MADHAPSLPCWRWDPYSRPALHPACAPSCSLHSTVGPLGSPCTAKSSCTPLPHLSTEAWVSAPCHCTHQQACISGWGRAVLRPGPSMLVFLYPEGLQASSHSLLSSLGSSLTVSADLQPEGWNLSYFTAPTQGQFPSPFFLFFSPSSYWVMWGSFLQLWLYEICKLPVGILWELLHI